MSKNLNASKQFANEIMKAPSLMGDLIGDLFAPTAIVYSQLEPQVGAGGMVDHCQAFFNAIPNMRYETMDLIEHKNCVSVNYISYGTHEQEFYGIAATGNTVRFAGVSTYYFNDQGKIEKYGFAVDSVALFQDFGLSFPEIMQLIPKYCKNDAQVLNEALQFLGSESRILSHIMVLCIAYKHAGYKNGAIAKKLGFYSGQVGAALEEAQMQLGCSSFSQLTDNITALHFGHVLDELSQLLVKNN